MVLKVAGNRSNGRYFKTTHIHQNEQGCTYNKSNYKGATSGSNWFNKMAIAC